MAQNRDIEGVLSAIRQLVADEAMTARPAKGAPTLLLSEAQRVPGPEDSPRDSPAPTPMDKAGAAAETTFDDEPFDIWSRAAEDLDLPQDYAEDADFEQAERIGPVRPGGENRMPAPARSSAPANLSDLSGDLIADDGLRDLVADVVRQELSGELGERITRNVRKLVRREIRQLLASRDMD